MTPTPHPQRRIEADEPAVRITGHTVRQLVVQVLGGLLIATVVAGGSVWGTVQILGEKVGAVSREVQQLRGDVQEMRRDLYRPRFERGRYSAEAALPPGSPP